MAPEMTPRTWPSEDRGLVDDAAEMAGVFRRMLEPVSRLVSRLAPQGSVVANLARGQVVALDGPRMAKVECLEGRAWVTCPSDGRDVVVRAGQALELRGPGTVAVSAMGGPARVRLGWR